MKPRFSFGRSQPAMGSDTEPFIQQPPELSEDAESPTSPELPGVTDVAPVRPDLGPPAPGPQSSNQPGSGLGLVISGAVAAVVFVLSIYASGNPTSNPLPMAQTTNALYWAVGAVAIAGAAIGAIYAERTASRDRQLDGDATQPNTAWIVPVVATATAVTLVATFHNPTMIVAGPLIAFLGNAGALLSRDLLDDADDSAHRTATTIHALVIHSVAFLALSAIYLNKLPTAFTALLAALVTALLTVEALDRRAIAPSRRVLLALVAGGTVAAASTPLMWWMTHGWTGGAVLFVVFYCAVGIIQTSVEQTGFRARDAIEYGAVPLAAFILLAITA